MDRILAEQRADLDAQDAARTPYQRQALVDALAYGVLCAPPEVERLRAMVVALESECAAYVDLLGSLELHIRWRHVTRQLTTEQKRLFADAVDLDSRRGGEPPVAERWWDWPPCEVCQAPIEARDGGWFDIHGRAGQDRPVNWAGVGPTPAHVHRGPGEQP